MKKPIKKKPIKVKAKAKTKTRKDKKQKQKKSISGNTKRKLGIPKWNNGDVNDDNLELFLELFPEIHKRFSDYYLLSFNARKSFNKIEPSANQARAKLQGHRLLHNDNVQLYLDYKSRKFNDEIDITRDQLMRELSLTKERCMQKYPVMEKINGELVECGEWKFDATNVLKSIAMQGKEIGMFRDRIQIESLTGSSRIVYHYVVPEIKPIELATKQIEGDVGEQIEQYIIDRRKKISQSNKE